jgi:hypothetical protein
MKKIKLTQGKYALIDNKDFKKVSTLKWRAHKTRGNIWYVESQQWTRVIYLHRFLMNPRDDKEVDHINRNGLDNRRKNLKICTRSENLRNRKIKSKSGMKGIHKTIYGRFQTNAFLNKKYIHLGIFTTISEAKKAIQKFNKKNNIRI